MRSTILAILAAQCAVYSTVAATGGLHGLPVLNGPINTVPQGDGFKTSPGDFVHPGLWHTHDDLERIRLGVQNKKDPWASAYANFSTDSFSQADVSFSKTTNPYQLLLAKLILPTSMSCKVHMRCSAEDPAATTQASAMTPAQPIKMLSCGTSLRTKAIGTDRPRSSTHGGPI